ncbi:hypothetical protein OXX59_000080 [Metschnikowia pulcherrima]
MSFQKHDQPSASLGPGKEKELPPIPPFSEPLMPPKSLKRKNVKQLSFSPAGSVPSPADYSQEASRLTALKNQPKKKHPRPAPLLNIDHSPAPTTSPQDLLDSFHNLDLHAAQGSPQLAHVQRKRRTVISSISPTKSPLGGPPSPNPAAHMLMPTSSAQNSPLPSTPLAATSAAMNLRDADLVHLKDLGSGNSGVVSKVLHVPSQKTMARKVVLVDSKSEVQTQIIRELRIMHECRSPYIIEFYGAFLRANNSIVLCMEYCNCGSLDRIVQLCNPRQFPLFVLKKLSFSILSGLTYLYRTHKIIHRDIKPSNVLMSHRGEFKLCDFGVSRELTNSVAMADTFVGTSTYMSPERIQGLTYGVKSDVWSMGLMLVELASGRSVWSEDDNGDLEAGSKSGPEGILDLLQRIVNETSPTLTGKTDPLQNQKYDAELCAFIDLCLIKDDSRRKCPDELLQERLLADVPSGVYDKDVKAWAKQIRKLHKETYEKE